MFYTFFKKCVVILTIISLLPLNAFAMDLEIKEENPQNFSQQKDFTIIDMRGENKENRPSAINRNPNHKTRTKLNSLLEKVIAPSEKVFFGLKDQQPLINENSSSEDKPPMVSALVIYNKNQPILQNEELEKTLIIPDKWDNHPFFLSELDKIFFNQNISKKTRVLQLITFLGGGLIARGWAPLVMFLAENILGSIPVGGNEAAGIVFTIMAITALPCAMQMAERVGIICNYLFNKIGFKPKSEGYKGPGIQKLKVEQEVSCSNKKCCGPKKCCRLHIPIHIEVFATVISYIKAAIRSAPTALLFWEAERYFPEFRAIFIAPIFLIYFERTLKDSMAFWRKFAHQQLTETNHMCALKKKILHNRLDEMYERLNLSKSDNLVKSLYEEIQRELNNKEDGEHISAFSLLFLKRYGLSSLDDLKEGLKEVSEPFVKKEDGKELKNIVDELGTVPMQGYANLFEDLGNLPPKPKAENILGEIPKLLQGAATVGRLLVTLWSVQEIMKYLGVGETAAFYTGIGVSIVDVIVRAVSEWYLQEETFAKVQHIASTKTSYWGLKYVTGAFAAVGSFFFSLAPVAIIFRVLGESCPLYVKVMIAAAAYPTEFSSLFRFIKEKYDNAVTNIAIYNPKTVSQKRAWLNYYIEKAHKFIDEADVTTTDDFYSVSQDSI